MTPGSAVRPGPRRALYELYPKRRVLVPGLLALSVALLMLGLSLPLMSVHQRLLWKRWENHYSVFTGALSLAHQGDYLLAAVLLFFSVLFPLAKLTALALIWWVRSTDDRRRRTLHWLGMLGKWSMLDVFVVAILIVLVKLGPLASVQPRGGVYFFASAILASMVTTMYVDRLARSSLRSR